MIQRSSLDLAKVLMCRTLVDLGLKSILSNTIKQKREERVMLSYYMNKMSLNTPNKSFLSMKC